MGETVELDNCLDREDKIIADDTGTRPSLAVAHLAFSLAKNLVKYYHDMRNYSSKILL
jgi:hypothetical protein